MADVLFWNQAAPDEETIARTLSVLESDGLVALPTETVYGIAARPSAAAVARLIQCKGRPDAKPLTLVLGQPREALKWVPGMGKLGRRLSQRVWPGPATLVFESGLTDGPFEQLPEAVRQQVAPHGSLGLRVPAHAMILEVLARLQGPLVLTSANRSGEADAVTGESVAAALGEQLQLIVDAGPTYFGRPSSVLRIRDDGWEMLREGVLTARLVQRLCNCLILFVCTGNTCRSPLAEGLCKKLLAERLECTPAELSERGFDVLSAGVSAMMGYRATPEAVATASQHQADLTGHVSQSVTAALLAQADHVFAMTEGHRSTLIDYFGGDADKIQLLSASAEDIADPIGQEQAVYDACASQIIASLQARIPEIVLSELHAADPTSEPRER